MTRTRIAAALVLALALGLLVELAPFGGGAAGPSADGAARRAEATRVGAEDTALLETPTTDLEGVRSPASAAVQDRPAARPSEPIVAPPIDSGARLVVRVVDPAGRPVPGVRIEWVTVDRRGAYDEWSIAPASDENGIVEVPGAGRFLDPLFHPEAADARWRVRVARAGLRTELPFDGRLPSADEPAPGVLWFDEEPPRRRPVVIALPPVGALRVTWDSAQRGDGAALTPDALVVQRIGAGAGGAVHRWRVSERVDPGAEELTLSPVGIGWELRVEARSGSVIGGLGSATGPGPTRDGETAHIHLPASDGALDLVHVRGVATDARGEPLARRTLDVRFDVKGAQAMGARVETTGDGAWSLDVPGDRLTAARRVVLTDESRQPPDAASRRVVMPSIGDDVIDLGEVALLPPEGFAREVRLVAGRVEDTVVGRLTGRGALVTVMGRVRSLEGKAMDPNVWTRLAVEPTDEDGAFDVRARADLADPVLRVTPSDADHLTADSVEVAAGTRDVRLLLARGSAVRLRIDADPWAVATDAITLHLVGEGRIHPLPLTEFARPGEPGRCGGLDPGRYTLELRVRGGGWVLHSQVVEVVGDVDIGRVDVRGALRVCHLTLMDDAGAPVERGSVSVVDEATGVTIDRSVAVGEGGRATAVIPADVDAVLVGPPGEGGGTARVPSSWFVDPDLETMLSPGSDPPRHGVRLR